MSNEQFWTHIPSPEKFPTWEDTNKLSEELLFVLLDIIQDGLCIIDRQMNLVYSNVAMQHWYGEDDHTSKKCYERYHGLEQPCANCPAIQAFSSGMPQTGTQILESKGKMTGRQRLYCVPLFNASKEPILMVEYVRDITNEKMAESTALLLEKQNAALQEHLQKSKEESLRLAEETTQHIHYIVDAIKKSMEAFLDERSYQKIESQIDRLLETFENRHSSLRTKLTEQEMAVAGYIVEGYVSKEIADMLGVSKKTVDFHRTNIRKKMMLGPNDNLRQRLKEELY